jgi:putative flavoprotein involved in K+ transport
VVIGTSLSRVKGLGVNARPRVTGAGPHGVEFADGTRLAPASVIWSTGFTADYTWVDVPGVITDTPRGGTVVHERGVTAVPGLYFIGLPWQHSRGSALLGFVRHDAAWLAERLYADRTQLPGL